MREGRSAPPPLPDEFYWIETTRLINAFLGSAYTIEQVRAMPSDEFRLLLMRIQNA